MLGRNSSFINGHFAVIIRSESPQSPFLIPVMVVQHTTTTMIQIGMLFKSLKFNILMNIHG